MRGFRLITLVALTAAVIGCSDQETTVTMPEQPVDLAAVVLESGEGLVPGTYAAVNMRTRDVSVYQMGEGPYVMHPADEITKDIADPSVQALVATPLAFSMPGDDPDCILVPPITEDDADAWAECMNGLANSGDCSIVVTELYVETGVVHGHCIE